MQDNDQQIHEFTVETVGYGFATVRPDLVLEEDVTVDETPLTRTVFRAEVQPKGVRGWIIKQKRNRGESWSDTKKIDFRKLKSGEGTSVELSTSALARVVEQYDVLQSHITQNGLRQGRHTYVSAAQDQVVIVNSRSIAASISALLEAQPDEQFWKELARNEPSLLRRLGYGAIHEDRRQQLEIFRLLLADAANLDKYATKFKLTDRRSEKVWQYFFEQNP